MYGMETPRQNDFRQVPVIDLSTDEKCIPIRTAASLNRVEARVETYWVPCFLPKQFEVRN